MANIIEIANSAYEERDRAQEKLGLMMKKAERERAVEIQGHLAVMGHEERERAQALERQQEEEAFQRQETDKSIGHPFFLSQTNNKLKVGVMHTMLADLKTLSHEKVLSYEEAFLRIEQFTGISDVDQLVESFIKAEEKNFNMFHFVNEQSQEIESLETQISDLTHELEMLKDMSENLGDAQRRKELRQLEQKLAEVE